MFAHEVHAALAHGLEGIIVDFASFDNRYAFVKESGEKPHEAGFCLAAETEKKNVMAGQNGVDNCRDYSFLVPYDTGKQRFVLLKFLDKIVADFLFDRDNVIAGLS
jgi:hypothetical protein